MLRSTLVPLSVEPQSERVDLRLGCGLKVGFIDSRPDLAEALVTTYPAFQRLSPTVANNLLAYFDDRNGMLVCLRPDSLGNLPHRRDHRSLVQMLMTSAEGRLDIPFPNILITQNPQFQPAHPRHVYHFLQNVSIQSAQTNLAGIAPGIGGIAPRITNKDVISALEDLYQHPALEFVGATELLTRVLGPQLVNIYQPRLGEASAPGGANKLLKFVEKLTRSFDAINEHNYFHHSAKNFLDCLLQLQGAGILANNDSDLRAVQTRFIDDFQLFLADYRPDLKRYHIHHPEVNGSQHVPQYEIPSNIFKKLFRESPTVSSLNELVCFYSLLDRSAIELTNYIHRASQMTTAPQALRNYCGHVASIFGKMINQQEVNVLVERDPHKADHRILCMVGELEDYQYRLTIYLDSQAPRLQLERHLVGTNKYDSLMISGSENEVWTSAPRQSALSRTMTRPFLPENPDHNLRGSWSSLLNEAKELGLTSFTETRLTGIPQQVEMQEVAPGTFQVSFRTALRNHSEQNILVFEHGKLVSIERLIEDSGIEEQVELQRRTTAQNDPNKGYPLMLNLFYALEEALHTASLSTGKILQLPK